MMCLAGFSMMYVISYICAETDSIFCWLSVVC